MSDSRRLSQAYETRFHSLAECASSRLAVWWLALLSIWALGLGLEASRRIASLEAGRPHVQAAESTWTWPYIDAASGPVSSMELVSRSG